MDKNEVRTKLIDILKIPISKVVIGNGSIEVWVNQYNIGNVFFNIGPAQIPIYTANVPEVLMKLRWDLVYTCWKNEIGECIKGVFGNEFNLNETTVTGFRYLLLRKKVDDKNPIRVQALYDGVNWNIYKD